jgi:hypothetical protein
MNPKSKRQFNLFSFIAFSNNLYGPTFFLKRLRSFEAISFFLIEFSFFISNVIADENFQTISDLNYNEISFFRKSPSISNLTALIGETVQFNCSLASEYDQNNINLARYSSSIGILPPNSNILGNDFNALTPTWLKADAVYNQYGIINAYKTENIIVTRKGIIADALKEKMKLISNNNNFQTLRISNVNVRNEGKYICRELLSQHDKLFYLNVFCKFNEFIIDITKKKNYCF